MITRCRTDAGAGRGNHRCAANRNRTGLVLVLCLCASHALSVQRPGTSVPKNSNVKSDERIERPGAFDPEGRQQRLTPLGVQVPVVPDLGKQSRERAVEPVSDALRRLGVSNGDPGQSRRDLVAEGTVTVHRPSGTITFGVTLIQNGEQGSQRILLRQSNGKLWDGRPDHLEPGARQTLEFVETQYRRGLQQLPKSSGRDVTIEDNGIEDSLRVITVKEAGGQSAKYRLDPATSRLASFEFARGQSPASIGTWAPIIHSYSFADFRDGDGIATPFHIEHFVNGEKQEELQLTKAQYNSDAIGASTVRPAGR